MGANVPLLERRFLVLSGKGGVGRTTVAAALAQAAVATGKRVLLAQMDAPARLARLLGHPDAIGAEVTTVTDGLDAVNMTPKTAMHQYGLMVLKYETLYRALFENRAMQAFLGAVPGLDVYSMLGKVWWHTNENMGGRLKYDLVILDGPASGHAITMLKIPQAILQAMPNGPLARDAGAQRALFSDARRSAFVIVTLPEDLPVRETMELARTVREELRMPLGPIVVNAVPPAVVAAPEARALLARLPRPTGDPLLDATLAGAAVLAGWREESDQLLAALARDPGLPLVELPRLPTADLGPDEIEELAALLYSRMTSS